MSRLDQKTATLAQSASVKPPGEPKAAPAPSRDGQAQKAQSVSQEMIQFRAYQKWEAAGKPQGNGVKFWLDAEQELLLQKKIGLA